MDLTFNQKAFDDSVKAEYKSAMKLIASNMKQGLRITDLYLPREVGALVRGKIEAEMQRQGKEYTWCVVRRGINPITNTPFVSTTEIVGDKKHYQFKYTG